MNPYQGNIGFLFTKLFFKGRPTFIKGKPKFPNMERHGKTLSGHISMHHFTPLERLGQHYFDLVTTYPGMLIGSGYPHDVHAEEGLKLGFYFDHATGMPIVPGSSVKGILKNAFDQDSGQYIIYLIKEMGAVDSERKLLNKENKALFAELKPNQEDITKWASKIFGTDDPDTNLPSSQRDVFHDAFPIESRNDNGQLMGNDYITPHKEPLKNPVPLQFLKVLPQVKYQFDFQLLDDENGLSANLKKELFHQIILDLGVGAKTNVGYGQFDTDFLSVRTSSNQPDGEKTIETVRTTGFTEVITKEHLKALEFDEFQPIKNEWKALITDSSDLEYQFKIVDEQFGFKADCYLVKKKATVLSKFAEQSEKRKKKGKPHEPKELEIGDEITLRINRQTTLGQINFTVLPIWKTIN